MIKYKIRDSDWLTFPLIIVNFNHFFIQPPPDVCFFLLKTPEQETLSLPSDSDTNESDLDADFHVEMSEYEKEREERIKKLEKMRKMIGLTPIVVQVL